MHDLVQTKHAIIRNFPVVGHGRYLLERFGPELRQYIVTSNDEERPFSRDQRRWVYASSKLENNYFGFGTDNDVEQVEGYPVIKHRTFTGPGAATMPHAQEEIVLPCAKVMGAARGRTHAFRPQSVVNISGMSFGSLSGKAIESLNKGAAMAGCLQNTGEGALSPHHRHGGDIVFQIGTSYFGCRDEHGNFDMARLVDLVQSAPVKAIEIKLSQGAKPGLGGMLPGEKVSREIAEIRGIPEGKDCASPSRHEVFGDVDSMLDFVESVAQAHRPARRDQVGGRQPDGVGRARRGDVRRRARGRLRQHRRRRGRHRGRADDLRRLGRLPLPDRLRRGLPPLRRGRPHRRRGLHRRRQARHPGERDRRVRPRGRHGQRRVARR